MLRAYIKIHRKTIAVFTFSCVAAALIFALYQLPVQAVLYAAAICLLFGMIVLGLDYGRFCLKHQGLRQCLGELGGIGENARTVGDTVYGNGAAGAAGHETEGHTHPSACGEPRFVMKSSTGCGNEAADAAGHEPEGLTQHSGYGEPRFVVKSSTGYGNGAAGAARVTGRPAQRPDHPVRPDPDVVLEHLPRPSGILEEDYQALLLAFGRERRALQEEMERRYRDMIDYYTVWAHQIKTPIAAMRLMLQEEPRPDSGLQEELRRVEQYVEMVLCYLRLDSDSTDYVFREYDLDAIVKQAVRRYASTFIQKKLRLEYEPLQARVVTDEKWLLFVIGQVLSNALKYTAKGAIAITLEPPKTLCIRDTGIGIAPEDLPRIFEKGYTGDNGRRDKQASGIGMYLCSRICANLGHEISVSSVPGQGTEVRIDLKNAELEIE